MSSLAFLVTELQSLASETKRKHPEIREAAERSLAILRSSPEQATASLASDGPQSDELLKPVFMGCGTKNVKVVAISLGSLQRLIALRAVPQRVVPLILSTMSAAVSQGVDIQLRILQTLLSLITNFPAVHGDLLGDALLLCFKLQESRIAVVSSTAAATLRQLVMFVVDKVVDEDRQGDLDPDELEEVTLPDGSVKTLGPSARDAVAVFEDLCLLANAEKPRFLKLDFLHKTFALELIESVLTNYHDLFRKHEDLLLLLQLHLCPLLLKALSDRPLFPLTLRCTRVVFLLLKQFSLELRTESEVFLVFLIKVIGDETETGAVGDHVPPHGAKPLWMRVLAMEIMRGLCSDAELIRQVWDRYDAQQPGSNIFTSLITALKRLVTEKPSLLGVGSQMFGVGVPSHTGEGYGLDVSGVAGMVATAASATVSGVVGMMASGHGLSLQGSAMKLQCIDQLDKADSPSIPESYIYLLGVQCIVSLCDGFLSFTAPLYTSIVIQKPRAAGDAVVRAPPALDLSTLPQGDPSAKQLCIVRDMIENGWPALLAALSFIISTNLSDDLFADVLASYQALTNVSGMLALPTPRDAFFTSLAKFAIPTRVVSSLDSYGEPTSPRSATAISESLGLSGPAVPPGLSERNMSCLKVLISSALFLAGSLGESWYGILEALQNADYILTSKGVQSAPSKRTAFSQGAGGTPANRSTSSSFQSGGSSQPQQGSRQTVLTDVDSETLQAAIQRLFDASKNLEDQAFTDFINALCRLSSEMVGMQTDGSGMLAKSDSIEEVISSATLSPRKDPAHRRRVSGIHLPRTLRSGDFGINKLGSVALLNIHRLIYRPPTVAWNTTTKHLLSIIRLPLAPQPIRVQAARVLDEILVIVPRNLTTTGDLQSKVQRQVLDVLAQQVIPDNSIISANTSITVELRRMGLETLHQILQASGHTLVIGWETIFEMLGSVCRPHTPLRSGSEDSLSLLNPVSASVSRASLLSAGLGNSSEKGYASLVKIAFQSLTLVCDSVSSLSPEHLRLCISTLGQFGRQSDTNIALTAAESLLWSVSDAIQYKRKDVDKEPEYSALWMFLLLEVLGLCADARPEVRVGAIQTLFRAMQLYGASLSLETWEDCMWKVTFPLLDSITSKIRLAATASSSPSASPASSTVTLRPLDSSAAVSAERAWDESEILALQSIGTILHDFIVLKIMRLDSFSKVWDVFVSHIQDAVLLDNRVISSPALRCLEKAVKASSSAGFDLRPRVGEIWERVWKTCDQIGDAILQKTTPDSPLSPSVTPHGKQRPFTQESLVAFVDVIQCTRNVSKNLDGTEWQLERLSRLMVILKGVLTYPSSPDYRPDIDALTPVQAVVLDAVLGIDLSSKGSPSLVMNDLSEYATLPFLAAFDIQPVITPASASVPTKVGPKRVTYIALSKKIMPKLVDLYSQFKDKAEIYLDGTLESVLSAYSIPVKLKYDCPAPSKFGKDPPLWKTATTNFLLIVKECALRINSFGKDVPDERVEGIWRQVIDVFRGGILADWLIRLNSWRDDHFKLMDTYVLPPSTAAEAFSLDEQDREENFDLALIGALEIDVVPHLGDTRLPDSLVSQLGKTLLQGSKLREPSPGRSEQLYSPLPPGTSVVNGHSGAARSSRESFHRIPSEREGEMDGNDFGSLVPRERFSFWCLDLLFLICSDTSKDHEASRRRLAALSIPALLNRCRTTLVGYVADESMRGNLPFPRAREDELIYVLRKLMELRLWPGTLWAALSDSPSKFVLEQPALDGSVSESQLISDAVKRSSIAHLFHFYPVLCEIASIPRKTPSTWVLAKGTHRHSSLSLAAMPTVNEVDETTSRGSIGFERVNGDGKPVELDARTLARECLKKIGKEMGSAGCYELET